MEEIGGVGRGKIGGSSGKLKADGGISWREEYEVLRRNYKLDSEYGSVPGCKENIKTRNEKTGRRKCTATEHCSSINWPRMVQGWRVCKVCAASGRSGVRLLFRLDWLRIESGRSGVRLLFRLDWLRIKM